MVLPAKTASFLENTRFAGKPAVSISTLVSVGITVPAAFVLKQLGFLNTINGALRALAFVAVCPSLMGWYLLDRDNSKAWATSMGLLLGMGATASIFGLVYTDNHAQDTYANCSWNLNVWEMIFST